MLTSGPLHYLVAAWNVHVWLREEPTCSLARKYCDPYVLWHHLPEVNAVVIVTCTPPTNSCGLVRVPQPNVVTATKCCVVAG
jgi:hypothetical protein